MPKMPKAQGDDSVFSFFTLVPSAQTIVHWAKSCSFKRLKMAFNQFLTGTRDSVASSGLTSEIYGVEVLS